MLKHTTVYFVLTGIALSHAITAQATVEEDLRALQTQVRELQQRQQQTEAALAQKQGAAASPNAFNPELALILSGTYGSYTQNPDIPATGFALLPNHHGYSRSFSLKESELSLSANIDPQFRGVTTLSLQPEGGLGVENAYVQTTAMSNGYSLKMGRFFSALGYLNEQHAHTWDFIDQPLVYHTFWDNQLGEDGLQLKWLAPTDTFIELGAEIGRGRGYPGTDRKDNNGNNATALYAHLGDDVGASHTWRAGVSLHETQRVNAVADAFGVTNSFNGNSRTSGFDFVWKYAPNGNTTVTSFKLQGEYFQRTETGLLTYDTAGTPVTGGYNTTRSGWYLQGVYQFIPRWRVGVRYDQLDAGHATVDAALINVPASYSYIPSRYSLMLDYSPSEFSRLRIQAMQDKSRDNLTDNQLFMQYIMSLGAHGAHQF